MEPQNWVNFFVTTKLNSRCGPFVKSPIQGVPGGHSIGHSMQKKCTCMYDLFRTVSKIELFHHTVHCTDEQHAMSLTRVAKCNDVDGGIFENVLY
jgi:hypothetical protein